MNDNASLSVIIENGLIVTLVHGVQTVQSFMDDDCTPINSTARTLTLSTENNVGVLTVTQGGD